MAQKQFLDLTGLSTFKDLMTQYIGTEDAKSIRSMSISGNTVNFYRSTDATGTVAYTITLPDTSGLIPKMSNADGGYLVESTSSGDVSETGYTIDVLMANINERMDKIIQPVGGKLVVSNSNGGVSETDTAISDLATNTYVGSIPSGATSTNVVDYINEVAGGNIPKIANATGSMVAKTTSTGTVIESEYPIDDLFQLGYISDLRTRMGSIENYVGEIPYGATADNVVDYIDEIAGAKMPKIANASGYRIVSSNSNGTVSETDIVAENVVTGYFYDGDKIGQLVAVASIYNELESTGYTINDLATKAYVGTIPSGASSSNVVAYVGEMTGSISNAQIDALFSAS